MVRNFDITDVEDQVVELLVNIGISKNVFTNRPKSAELNLDDFVVVRVSDGLLDEVAYATCRVAVALYAKDAANFKRGKKLSVMFKTFDSYFPPFAGRCEFQLEGKRVHADVSDGAGYHYRKITFLTHVSLDPTDYMVPPMGDTIDDLTESEVTEIVNSIEL